MNFRVRLVAAVVCVLAGVCAFGLETDPKAEEILKKIEAKSAEKKGLDADMTMSMKMMNMKTEGKGHIKTLADGKHFIMDMTMKVMGMEMKTRSVCDGTTMWTETAMPQGKMVQKMSMATMEKMGGGNQQNPLEQVKQMRQQYTFTGVSEGKVQDTTVYILEGVPNPDAAKKAADAAKEAGGEQAAKMAQAQLEMVKKVRVYIGKDDLMFRKLETLDAGGEPIMSMELSNIKLDEKADPELFKYTPPEGAQVMDMDEMMKKMKQGQQ
ncbi:MAG TPA: hypothetical protein VGP72_01120 [Planctomycetota bacterium]|jgi:outer membrane lipoprotein-sorting protein